ncbi:MAG: methyltransferase domain-containing protein [Pseudomonadota bacterium]
MSADAETLRVYDAKAEDYAKLVSTSPDTQLRQFMAALPPGGDVLDLGCGPGNSAAMMAQTGFSVEAADASQEMVALAGRQDGVTARLASFDDVSGEDIYDGIWANFSLLHADRADMPRHLAALRLALRAEGVFHIGMKTGSGAERDGLGRYYAYYTTDELIGLLGAAGFEPLKTHTGVEKGLAGTMDPWITLLCHGLCRG